MDTLVSTTLPDLTLALTATNCCPLIDPSEWDGRTFAFDEKLFVKVKTRSFMHVPLNMEHVMKDIQDRLETANIRSDDLLILSDEHSSWHADHYLSVTREMPGFVTEAFSGLFMTKVFDGPYKDAARWQAELASYVRGQGETPLKTYLFYTACPRCAKVYHHNYVIGFAKISENTDF